MKELTKIEEKIHVEAKETVDEKDENKDNGFTPQV